MIDLRRLDAYRYTLPGFAVGGAAHGAFEIPHRPTGVTLRVIASSWLGWDHVSVSLKNRCPNWPEMSNIKRLFFHDHEVAMQLHVPSVEHVNNHPYCLHLWRPHGVEIPQPPAEFVGAVDVTPEQMRRMTRSERLALNDAATDRLLAKHAATAGSTS